MPRKRARRRANKDKENLKEIVSPQQDNSTIEDNALVDSNLLKKPDDIDYPIRSKGNKDLKELDIEKVDNDEEKLKRSSTKKRGRKPSSLTFLETSKDTNEKESKKMINSRNDTEDEDKDKNKMSNTNEYDAELVATQVKVWWPDDKISCMMMVKRNM